MCKWLVSISLHLGTCHWGVRYKPRRSREQHWIVVDLLSIYKNYDDSTMDRRGFIVNV